VRIVVDTNVVVSGLLSDNGAPAQVVDLVLTGDIDLVVDDRIITEYTDLLARPELALDPTEVTAFLGITAYAEHVVGVPIPVTLPDPDDVPFLEVAVAAAADAIVTGNLKHFRTPEGTLAIPLLTPRQLLDHLGGA
jgi:putative PIN family toxin of toxin-antitoxin system